MKTARPLPLSHSVSGPAGLAVMSPTVTFRVLGLAHWPAPGVKVRVKAPGPVVAGLKVLLDTPGPDQEPAMPLWLAERAAGGEVWQKGPIGVSAGVVRLLTVTLRVLARAHCPAEGVKVRLKAPAEAGLKVLLVTPGPDQEPVMPLWLVGRLTAGSPWQKGP